MNYGKLITIVISGMLFLQFAFAEYLYPVKQIGNRICVLYQKNDSHLEVWLWDPITQAATKALLSAYTPAGISVLPHNQGFSFVDNDRIRIKYFEKRSPKTIDLYGPYDITTLSWIDDENFYFSAREGNHFNLFHGTLDGDLYHLTSSKICHYLYPQKVNTKIFFLEEQENGLYTICSAPYPKELLCSSIHEKCKTDYSLKTSLSNVYSFSEKIYLEEMDIQRCITIDTFHIQKVIAFLYMENSECGYFIEHPAVINKKDEFIDFQYKNFFYEDNLWHIKTLFTFKLPAYFFIKQHGHNRLYESILPLLPKHTNTHIYYSTVQEQTGAVDIFMYEKPTGLTSQVTYGSSTENHVFSPCIVNGAIYYGGSVQAFTESGQLQSSPYIFIDVDEQQHFHFPMLER